MLWNHRSLGPCLALFASVLLGGCCVTPPTAEEILDLGFRSPKLTLRTFQAGVRGDLPLLEYRCFSQGYKSRNHLSQLAYREFREQELASNPWFQKGVADARILTSESLGEGRHLLRVGSQVHVIEVELVREDFWQLWSNTDLLADELLAHGGFSRATDVLDTGKAYHMEPMDARERRLVHMGVADEEGIKTYTQIGSRGKYVVIAADDGPGDEQNDEPAFTDE